MRTVLTAAGARVLQVVAERFAPQGVTVVALLAESHASLHTWPGSAPRTSTCSPAGTRPTRSRRRGRWPPR
ncbi:S-adenosylmethionine decarboxylase family protein [Pseudonocardia sp. T1-2H]|uniref:S-adenosylmethionine decarboxylase family protein n=1 Tax=Pseudonocardia sp. T1-2H TaxID=3128899 RepID=UPI0040542EDD